MNSAKKLKFRSSDCLSCKLCRAVIIMNLYYCIPSCLFPERYVSVCFQYTDDVNQLMCASICETSWLSIPVQGVPIHLHHPPCLPAYSSQCMQLRTPKFIVWLYIVDTGNMYILKRNLLGTDCWLLVPGRSLMTMIKKKLGYLCLEVKLFKLTLLLLEWGICIDVWWIYRAEIWSIWLRIDSLSHDSSTMSSITIFYLSTGLEFYPVLKNNGRKAGKQCLG